MAARSRPTTALLLALALTAATSRAASAPNDEVRFGPEADYGPFVYVEDDGRVAGLSIDMLERVARSAKLRLRTLPARPLNEWLELARRGEVDLLSSLRPTPERGAFLLFSRPYVSVPAVLVVRSGHALAGGSISAPLRRVAGQAVAVGAGYAVESFVRAAHPDVRWQAVTDDATALRGVVDGRFAGAVVDHASAGFVARRFGLESLAVAGPIGFEYPLSFAVRKDRPDLVARIDAAIHAIPATERTAIVERWMQPLDRAGSGARDRLVLASALALLILGSLLAVAGWMRQRAKEPR